MSVNNKLALSVHLVANYLQNQGVGNSIINYHQESNLIRASLADERTKVFINIVGVGIEPTKAMVSLYQGDKSLGQGILDYNKDLLIDDIEFPVNISDFLKSRRNQILEAIDSKYKLSPPPRKVPLQETFPQESSEPIPVDVKQTQPLSNVEPIQGIRGSRPPDMPDFEDEYQVRGEPDFTKLQQPLSGYGDSDLYPMGRSNPLMGDPLMAPPPGGMVLDPMQDAARRRQLEDMKNRGPGFMPGSRWDDPFGRPGFGAPGGPGPGGFI